MTDLEKEFFAYLGLLSVKYAVMENNLSLILAKLIGTNDELILSTLLENNSISQNIELIKKINRHRWFREEMMTDLISEINKIKSDRNLFIHGTWGDAFIDKTELKIKCGERKLKYSDKKNSKGKVYERSWIQNDTHVISLGKIKNMTDKIEEILHDQNQILNELKNILFD